MYIDSDDYQSIWKLAHNWVSENSEATNPEELSKDLQVAIQRIASAILSNALLARSKRLIILQDDSFLTFIFDFRHIVRLYKCVHSDKFNKAYLDSIYVKRSHVIDWCKKEYLSLPPIWDIEENLSAKANQSYDATDDENEGWYNELSERRKKRVVCLDLAGKLWLINPNQTYEEIYNHPTMKQFGNPNVFSFEAFKKWSRPIASEYAKTGGRPIKNK